MAAKQKGQNAPRSGLSYVLGTMVWESYSTNMFLLTNRLGFLEAKYYLLFATVINTTVNQHSVNPKPRAKLNT